MNTIFNLPHRAEYLKYTLPRRMVERFCRNEGVGLPNTQLMTFRETKAKFKIETSFIDYSKRLIVIAIDENWDAKRQWAWATMATVHECAHDMFDFSPRTLDIKTMAQADLLNVLRDCKNEQRVLLEDRWAGTLLKRGRGIVLNDTRADYRVPTKSDYLYGEARNLILISHTVCMAKYTKVLKLLHQGKIDSKALWVEIEKEGFVPSPELRKLWNEEAFPLVARMWCERNNWILREMMDEFMAMFPPPLNFQEPETKADIGGHRGNAPEQSTNGNDAREGKPQKSEKTDKSGSREKSPERKTSEQKESKDSEATDKSGGKPQSEKSPAEDKSSSAAPKGEDSKSAGKDNENSQNENSESGKGDQKKGAQDAADNTAEKGNDGDDQAEKPDDNASKGGGDGTEKDENNSGESENGDGSTPDKESDDAKANGDSGSEEKDGDGKSNSDETGDGKSEGDGETDEPGGKNSDDSKDAGDQTADPDQPGDKPADQDKPADKESKSDSTADSSAKDSGSKSESASDGEPQGKSSDKGQEGKPSDPSGNSDPVDNHGNSQRGGSSSESNSDQPAAEPVSYAPIVSDEKYPEIERNEADNDAEEGAEVMENEIMEELDDANREARAFIEGAFPAAGDDIIRPATPTAWIQTATPYVPALARELKVTLQPRINEETSLGRLNISRIIRFPETDNPFDSRTSLEMDAGRGLRLTVICDTSGSMKKGGKIQAAKVALMTAHLTCRQVDMQYQILTSRTLCVLASSEMSEARCLGLIAGLSPHQMGDNYLATLPFLLTELKQSQQAQDQIVVVITDGQPHGTEGLTKVVSDSRDDGFLIVGLGLNLSLTEKRGMETIFGKDFCVHGEVGSRSGSGGSFAEILGQTLTRLVRMSQLR